MENKIATSPVGYEMNRLPFTTHTVQLLKKQNDEVFKWRPLTGSEITHIAEKLAKRLRNTITAVALLLFVLMPSAHASQTYVEIANKYIGQGETRGDNKGDFISKILRSKKPNPWCAAFVSHVLHEGGYQGPYRLRARDFLKDGSIVNTPAPGDLIVFSRGKNPKLGHVGIIKKVDGESISYIDGNSGKFPSVVSERILKPELKQNLIGYVRIEK